MLTNVCHTGSETIVISGGTKEIYVDLRDYWFKSLFQTNVRGPYHTIVGEITYEDKEVIIGLMDKIPFWLQGDRNDISLRATLDRAWGVAKFSKTVVSDRSNTNSEKARGAD